MNDKKLYSGDLLAVSLNKAVSLGEFSSGEKGNMRFEVTVPAELDNLYALRAADVKWIFSVEEDQETADTSLFHAGMAGKKPQKELPEITALR